MRMRGCGCTDEHMPGHVGVRLRMRGRGCAGAGVWAGGCARAAIAMASVPLAYPLFVLDTETTIYTCLDGRFRIHFIRWIRNLPILRAIWSISYPLSKADTKLAKQMPKTYISVSTLSYGYGSAHKGSHARSGGPGCRRLGATIDGLLGDGDSDLTANTVRRQRESA